MPDWQMTENPFLVLQLKMMMVFCVKYTIKKKAICDYMFYLL